MDWRMVKERENDWLFIPFDTLIVIDWEMTNWEGIPEITPVDSLRIKPEGRDPDVIENIKSSPLTIGVTENDSSFAKVYTVWE